MSYTAHADWRSYRDARRAARAEWLTHGCGGFFRPVELIAMILGFIFFFPIGLAILFWRLVGRPDLLAPFRDWVASQRHAHASATASGSTGASAGAWGCGSGSRREGLWTNSGNVAFEEYKARELARLEEERRRLAEEQKAFGAFMEELRRAKDREEFDRFMAGRAAPSGPAPTPPETPPAA